MQENSEILNSRAIELATDGAYPEAVACLKRALSIDRDNYLLWFNLGVIYRNSGDLEFAKQALKKAASINSEDADIFETLGLICYSLQEYDDAYGYYIAALEITQDNATLWNNLGVLLFARGEYADVCEAFEEAITIFPHYYDALYNLRDTYTELGNTKGAAICNEQLKTLGKQQKGKL